MRLDGVKVLGTTADIPALARQYDIGMIFYTITRISEPDRQRILGICRQTGIHLVKLPDMLESIHTQLRRDVAHREPRTRPNRDTGSQAAFLSELQVEEEA